MKRILTVFLALALALPLAACGAAANNRIEADTNTTMTESYDRATSTGTGWATQESKSEPEAPAESLTDQLSGTVDASTALANTKMIYTGELYLQTKEFDSAMAALDQLVASLGGYYEQHELSQGSSYRSLHATVRVPSEQFNAFLDQAGEAAYAVDRYAYQEDISEQYYDVESRLITQRTKLERLQELLAQAESMEDIITLESAISDTELAIEQLTGSLRKYDSLVGYSTIILTLSEVYRLSSEETPVQTFGERLSSAFTRGWERGVDGLEDFVIGVARNWLSLLIVCAVAVPVAVVLRRKWRERRKKRVPDQPDSADDQK